MSILHSLKTIEAFGILLTLAIILTLGSEVKRGQRSDDSSPLEAVVATLSQKVDQLKAHISAQDSQIAALTSKLAVAETPVAFSVKFSDSIINHLGSGQILKYDLVMDNLGNGYNKDTGFFTAPSAGTYVFYFMVAAENNIAGACTQVDLLHNSQWLLTADACNHYMNTGSNLAVRYLNAGDTMHVQMRFGDAVHADYHTSFSGWKVSPQ